MIQKLFAFGFIFFLFVRCNNKNEINDYSIDTTRKNISVPKESIKEESIKEESTSESNEDYYTVCYQDLHSRDFDNINENASIEQGIAGIYKGKKYYYEIWRLPGGLSMNINYLFLRTDTIFIDSLDFCFCEQPLPENLPDDSVIFYKLNKQTEERLLDSTMNISTFPDNFQPLIFSLLGYYDLYNINKPGG